MTYLPPQRQPPYPPQLPVHAEGEGVYLTIGDGFRFGVGFGLALTIALPVILVIISCFLAFIMLIFGSALGGLLSGAS